MASKETTCYKLVTLIPINPIIVLLQRKRIIQACVRPSKCITPLGESLPVSGEPNNNTI